jgi:hypothetical protein
MGDVIQSRRNGNALMVRLDFFAEMGRVGNFSGAALLVAFNLLYRHMNGTTGRCDPAIATLAEETGLQERSVQRAIRELEQSGWWHVAGRSGAGRGHTNSYRPNFEKGDRNVTFSGAEKVTDTSPFKPEKGDQSGQEKVTNWSPEPGKNQEVLSYLVGEALFSFEEAWRAYPSRGPHPNPKKRAMTEFAAALKRGADPVAIIRGTENYARYVDEHVGDRQRVAMMATWLNEDRWNDHQEIAQAPRRRLGTGMF